MKPPLLSSLLLFNVQNLVAVKYLSGLLHNDFRFFPSPLRGERRTFYRKLLKPITQKMQRITLKKMTMQFSEKKSNFSIGKERRKTAKSGGGGKNLHVSTFMYRFQ